MVIEDQYSPAWREIQHRRRQEEIKHQEEAKASEAMACQATSAVASEDSEPELPVIKRRSAQQDQTKTPQQQDAQSESSSQHEHVGARKGVKRKQQSTEGSPKEDDSASDPALQETSQESGAGSEDIGHSNNWEAMSEDRRAADSSDNFIHPANSPPEGPLFHAAVDNEEQAARDAVQVGSADEEAAKASSSEDIALRDDVEESSVEIGTTGPIEGSCHVNERPTAGMFPVAETTAGLAQRQHGAITPSTLGPPRGAAEDVHRSHSAPVWPLAHGCTVVHSEQNGRVQTVRHDKLGTSFFFKLSLPGLHYEDPKNGPQGCSKRFAAVMGHHVEVRHLTPHRNYGSYPDWPTAAPLLEGQLHLEEVMPEGRPCKPFLDMERDQGLPPGETLSSVIAGVREGVKEVFSADYGLHLADGDFNWLPCDYGPKGKFSLHMVISTHAPQLVYRSNLAPPADPQGAGHLARRLANVLPAHLADLIDQSVFTRNRGMRLPFCSKPKTPGCPLVPLDPSKPLADSTITWIEEDVRFIPVPILVPDAVRENRPRRTPADMAYVNPQVATSFAAQRCLELLQEGLHPTAYKRGSSRALSFGWTDREGEPCYTGHIHSGDRDIICIIDEPGNAVLAKCCSERIDAGTGVCCKEQRAFYLGPLHVDVESWRAGAVEIDVRFLERDPMSAGPMDLCLIRAGAKPLTDAVSLNDVLNRWQAGRFKALLLRSPMGTGKSTLLRALMAEQPCPQTALMITYRQTQASDAHGKNADFFHYNHLKDMPARYDDKYGYIEALADRQRFPRVICQVDSIRRLLVAERIITSFDLIILDESESIFSHLSATTLKKRYATMGFMAELFREAKKIVALDGHLGQRTYDFLAMNGVGCGPAVINKHAPDRPLCFEFVAGKDGLDVWTEAVCGALFSGENCFVVSMSSEAAYRLAGTILGAGIVDPSEVLVVTRHSAGEVKKGLENVNDAWLKRIVIISPTVEAGVDFSREWFDRTFIYMCTLSTTPRGLDQMKGRVRNLRQQHVMCFVHSGIVLPTVSDGCLVEAEEVVGVDEDVYLTQMADKRAAFRRVGIEETYQFLRWVEDKVEVVAKQVRQRGEEGVVEFVPDEDAVIRLLAHNEAETRNGATHFYEEFTSLVAEEGHVVLGVRRLGSSWAAEEEGDEDNELVNPRPTNYMVARLLAAPDISSVEFARIEEAVRRHRDREGDKAKLERFMLTRFYRLCQINEKFLETYGGYPLDTLTFLHQVVDPEYKHNLAEVGRASFPPLMVEIARELLSVLGFAHPLDYEHVTLTFEAVRPALLSTAFFSDYARNVQLFDSRARSAKVLEDQKSTTHALNHVMKKMGLRLTAVKLGRQAQADGTTKKRAYIYGGWMLQYEPASERLPIIGPPGVRYMAQLLRLRVQGSAELRDRISPTLRAFLDNVPPMFEGCSERACNI